MECYVNVARFAIAKADDKALAKPYGTMPPAFLQGLHSMLFVRGDANALHVSMDLEHN
jgi:hypothetical protein